MTKTMKKGLLVVLFVVMAVAIGFASYAAFGTAKAEEVNQDNVDSFVDNMELFDDKTIDETTLFPEEEPYPYVLWNAYTAAKRLYGNFNDTERQLPEVLAVKANYDKLDGILNKYYTLVSTITSSMYRYRNSNTYADNAIVEAARADYNELDPDDPTDSDKLPGTAQQAFVYSQTNSLANLLAAEARMEVLAQRIKDIIDAIKLIQYYNGADMVADPVYSGEADNMMIVLDSEESIKNVETVITENDGTVTAGAKLGAKTTSEFVDSKFVVGSEETGDADVDYWAYYEAAQTALAAQKAKAQAVIEKIDTVFGKKVDGTLYYTIRKQIAECRTAYDALEDKTTHNDLQSLVSNYASKLQDMESYITTLNGKITDLEDLIDTLRDTEAKFATEEEHDYLDAIKAVETALKGIDADVKAYDEARYATDTDHKDKTDTYTDVVAGETFGGDFDEFNKSFIIDEFDVYKKARAQYDEWQQEVNDLIQKVKDMIAADVAGENITKNLNDINSKYLNPSELTPEQLEVFKKTTVEVKAVNDKVTAEDDEKPFSGDEATCEDVMAYYTAFVDRMQALTSDLDGRIQALYLTTVGIEQCVYPHRDEVKELLEEYNELCLDENGERNSIAPYVTHSDELFEMETEMKAEDALVEAWIAAVDAIQTPITVSNWDKVEAAETAFAAILHSTGNKCIQDLIEDASNDESVRKTVANEKDIDASYTKYTTLVAARDYLKNAIDDAVKAMEDIEMEGADNLQLPQATIWSGTVDAATTKYDAIADTAESTNENASFAGAQKYLQDNNAETYADYQRALIYQKAYHVEDLIDELAKDQDQGYTAASDVKVIKLGDQKAIADARTAYDEYKGDTANTKPIRNEAILFAAEENFKALVKSLNDWMLKVYGLFKNDAETKFAGKEGATLTEALNAALTVENVGTYAYPLNIYKNDSGKLEDGKNGGIYSTDYLLVEYGKFSKSSDNDEQGYVAAGKTVLDKLIANWGTYDPEAENPEVEGGKGKWTVEGAGKTLQDRINAINEKVSKGQDLTTADLTEVQKIQDIYGQLHQSQKEQIKDYDKFQEAVDDKIAADAFRNMYTELYKQVTNGNISALTGYYIAVVRNVYNSFTSNVKAQFSDYSEKMAAIQEAYDAAVKADATVSLGKVSEDLKTLRDEYDAKVAELEGTISDLQTALDKLEEDYAAADEALKEELEGEIAKEKKALQDQIDTLKATLKTLQEETIPALEGRIAALETAKTQLENQLATLTETVNTNETDIEGKITAANQALETAKTEFQGKIDKLTSDLAAAKTDLQGKIDKLTSDLAAAKKASDDAVKALEDKMNAADEELKKADEELSARLDKLNTTVTAVSVVFAVLLAGAFVCIVLLFIKKKA